MTDPGSRGSVQVIHGSALDMRDVAAGSAALVITSPPFFPPALEHHFRAPLRSQVDFEAVRTKTTAFGLKLRPAFEEIRRVLKPGGHLVLETKDLRFGPHLIALSSLHTSMADAAGLRLTTRVLWKDTTESPRHGTMHRSLERLRSRHIFRTLDTEEFLVFAYPIGDEIGGDPEEFPAEEVADWVSPLWALPSSRSWHPYPSPEAVIRRFVVILSRRGDLVVDPFAGSGTVLRVAAEMGRNAIGYEIDHEYWARAVEGTE